MQKVFEWIRHCPKCGKSWGRISWLCLNCKLELYKNLTLKSRRLSSRIEHHYLFDWRVGDDLTPIVHSLKGGGHQQAISELIETFRPKGSVDYILFPKGKSKDHAWEIAQAFSRIHGGTPIGLAPRSNKKQSLLSKRARGLRAFNPIFLPMNSLHFVDDIVTTGATLKAADRALGQPTKMTVWSLFYRNSL